MKKLLVIVDMQNDFIDGALGSKEAQAIVPKVVRKISKWTGDVVCTMDTHYENYLETREGRKLPVPHCIVESEGWQVNDLICVAIKTAKLRTEIFVKETFGSTALAEFIEQQGYGYIEFVGLCTDICVISNVMLVKAALPEAEIVVDASCCAGVTPDSHRNALTAMKSCQVEVVNE